MIFFYEKSVIVVDEDLLRLIQDKNILEKIVKDKKAYVRSSEDMASEYIDIFEAI